MKRNVLKTPYLLCDYYGVLLGHCHVTRHTEFGTGSVISGVADAGLIICRDLQKPNVVGILLVILSLFTSF